MTLESTIQPIELVKARTHAKFDNSNLQISELAYLCNGIPSCLAQHRACVQGFAIRTTHVAPQCISQAAEAAVRCSANCVSRSARRADCVRPMVGTERQ